MEKNSEMVQVKGDEKLLQGSDDEDSAVKQNLMFWRSILVMGSSQLPGNIETTLHGLYILT